VGEFWETSAKQPESSASEKRTISYAARTTSIVLSMGTRGNVHYGNIGKLIPRAEKSLSNGFTNDERLEVELGGRLAVVSSGRAQSTDDGDDNGDLRGHVSSRA